MKDQLFVPRPFYPQLNQKSSLNTFRSLLEAGRHLIYDSALVTSNQRIVKQS